MPFTLAHPAAVLPLKRICPKFGLFPALVAGSLAPDLPYFIFQWNIGGYAHTPLGMITLGIPIGLFLMLVYYLFGRTVADMLPPAHKAYWFVGLQSPKGHDLKLVLLVVTSLLLGIASHVVWDSFTHSSGWTVHEAPVLAANVAHVGNVGMPLFRVLQHGSTVVGMAILLLAYWLGMKKYRAEHPELDKPPTPAEKTYRIRLWAVIFLVPLIISLVLSSVRIALALKEPGVFNLAAAIITCVIYYVDFYVIMLIAASLWHRKQKIKAASKELGK